MPYNQIPTGLRGYYKYNVATADQGVLIAIFRKSGTSIGTYYCKIGGVKNDYTLFNITFNPVLTQIPDSVIFGAVSSDFTIYENGIPGSILFLDSVSFTGVTSQPALMNGDFELWETTQTPEQLLNWPSTDYQSIGVSKTTDVPAKTGKYALQLTTTSQFNKQGIAKAQSGFISTGYYDNSCNCMKGGTPFVNPKDTFAFWYKYAPTTITNAEMSLQFKKNGSFFMNIHKVLGATSNYQYLEMPFELWQAPDSVVVQIISSSWKDSALTFVGSVLKIDSLHFKSQGIKNSIVNLQNESPLSIYPNPSNGKFQFRSTENELSKLEIYNSIGTKVFESINCKQFVINDIDISNSPKGIYFVKVQIGEKSHTKKILVI